MSQRNGDRREPLPTPPAMPFRPFTAEEINQITGCPPKFLDEWMTILGRKEGCGVLGLDDIQTFAVFVAYRYMTEGAPTGRIMATMRSLAMSNLETVRRAIANGISFLAAPEHKWGVRRGVFVTPPDSRLGRALDLAKLLPEFEAAVKRVFPF